MVWVGKGGHRVRDIWMLKVGDVGMLQAGDTGML